MRKQIFVMEDNSAIELSDAQVNAMRIVNMGIRKANAIPQTSTLKVLIRMELIADLETMTDAGRYVVAEILARDAADQAVAVEVKPVITSNCGTCGPREVAGCGWCYPANEGGFALILPGKDTGELVAEMLDPEDFTALDPTPVDVSTCEGGEVAESAHMVAWHDLADRAMSLGYTSDSAARVADLLVNYGGSRDGDCAIHLGSVRMYTDSACEACGVIATSTREGFTLAGWVAVQAERAAESARLEAEYARRARLDAAVALISENNRQTLADQVARDQATAEFWGDDSLIPAGVCLTCGYSGPLDCYHGFELGSASERAQLAGAPRRFWAKVKPSGRRRNRR